MSTKEQPRRLGKGLVQLMGNTAAAAGHEGARNLAIASLHPGPFQPRRGMDDAALEELAASLRSRGVLQPLLVRAFPDKAGQFQIIAGERRWRAAQRAGLHEVPVLVRDLTDADAMAAGLVENLQRQDLDPIEEAEGYQRLLDEFGMIQEDLATAVAKSRPHISNMLRLLNLPQSVQASVRAGELSAGHARALIQHPDPEAGARAILAQRMSVRQAEQLAQSAQTPKSPAKTSRPQDPETRALERDLSERLGLSVRISFNGMGGAVTLTYQDLDQLDGIIALLNNQQ